MADILPPIKKSVTICKSSEFPPGTKHVVSVEGRNILVTNHKGSLFACDNACYHMGMPLQSGDIEDMNGSPCLTCPWHKYIIALDSGDGYYWGLEPSADGKPVKVLKGKGPRQRTYPLYEKDGNIQLDVDTTKGGEWASDEYAAKARVNKKEHVTCHLVDGNSDNNHNNENVSVDGEVTIHSRIHTAGGQPPPGIHSSAGGGGFLSSGQVFAQNKTSATTGLAGSGGFSLRARALAQARLVQAGSNNNNNNDDAATHGNTTNNNNHNPNQSVVDVKCVAREIDSKDKTVCTFKFNAILSAAAHAMLIKPGMWARIRLSIPIPLPSSSSSSSDFSASSNGTALPVAEDGASPHSPPNPFTNNKNNKNKDAKTKNGQQQFQIVERQWTVTAVGGGSLFSLTIRHVPFDPKAKGEDGNFAVGGASHYLHTVPDINSIKSQLLEVGGDFHLGALRSDISHYGGNVLWLTAGIGITPFFGFLAAVEQQQQFFGGFSNNSNNNNKPFFTIVHLHNEKKHHALACEENIHKHLKSGVVQSMSLFLTQEERRSTSPANTDGIRSNASTPVTQDGENKIVLTADEHNNNNNNNRQKHNISPNADHSGSLPRALTTIPGRRMSAEDILTALTSQQIASSGNPSKFMVMMCGPEEFMDFCLKVLIEEGKVPKSAIFKEKFM